MTVDYSGKPGDIRQGDVQPWWSTNGEWTAAGEPESAAWWYPSNDHPSDPALMDVSIRVPAGMEAISVGRLESADTGDEKDFDTWHWIARQPMATYVNFVSIGQYELKQGIDHGLPYVYAVSEQLSARGPEEGVRRADELRRCVSGRWRRCSVPTRSPSSAASCRRTALVRRAGDPDPAGLRRQVDLERRLRTRLLDHELAHMWFGDNVTVRQWNDIFNSEAYASWAQWGAGERRADVRPTRR